MNAWANVAIQSLLTVIQVINFADPFFPDWKFHITLAVGILQIVVSRLSQNFNTDGTHQSEAYFTPQQKLSLKEVPQVNIVVNPDADKKTLLNVSSSTNDSNKEALKLSKRKPPPKKSEASQPRDKGGRYVSEKRKSK